MDEEPADPRSDLRSGYGARGGLLAALASEDLDAYAVAELDARVAALEAEIARARAAAAKKSSGLAAADALFSFRS